MLSFLVFPKPVNATYLMGVAFVLLGLAMNIMIKASEKKDKLEGSSSTGSDDLKDVKKDGTLNV
eukprot:CAMPEP_0114425460 /NCGR_PEP_ID=MMETSP0103-20121206/7247_1 /TAXON_ID=37642 ORGANISM="Paraphysomonas imperforata, Strain PA2" /NCGR_SAMPLE_ID=MMETSP0103 /ASSEMBLY_ACC=CAM_ASM_000201 /LENGTH=63 /DNA_ID=CAMNT_0001594297 /DNA_START=751 /DNA_END=942 /DNA_ORIENTATION=+